MDQIGKILEIPVIGIRIPSCQPRRMYDDKSLSELAESIREHGILQPLIVCEGPGENEYILISGERRLRAARLLSLLTVPCIVFFGSGLRSSELSLIENLWYEKLDMFEQAAAIAALIDLRAMTQEQIAKALSLSQSHIANKLRILRLSNEERKLILSSGLSERHARTFLRIRDLSRRIETVRLAAEHHWNVAETEAYIDGLLSSENKSKDRSVNRPDPPPSPSGSDASHALPRPVGKPHPHRLIVKDVRILFNTVDHAVSLIRDSGISLSTEQEELSDAYRYCITVPKKEFSADPEGSGTAEKVVPAS